MKHGLKLIIVLLIIISIGIIISCDKDEENENNLNGPDMSCWPANLPTFDYGDVYAITCEDGVFETAAFHNVSNPQNAFNGYKNELENSGWELDTDMSTDFMWGVMYELETSWVQLTIQKDDSGGAQIYYDE